MNGMMHHVNKPRPRTIKHAWSLRKVVDTYNGYCIRVKRSSDSSELDIGFDGSGDLDTSSLTTFVGANDGIIVTWYDQGYSGDDFTTDNDLSRIIIGGVLNEKNSKPAIYINLMYSENAFLPEKYTALYCVRCNHGTSSGNSNTIRGYYSSGYWRWGYHFSSAHTGRRFSNNGGNFFKYFTIELSNQSIYGECHSMNLTWHGVYNGLDIGTNILPDKWSPAAGIQIYGSYYQEIIIHDYNADEVSGTHLNDLLTAQNSYWGAY